MAISAAIIISLDRRCNNRCLFCSQADLPSSPSADVVAQLEAAFARGCRRADFVGGEPTLDAGLVGWIADARRLGFERIGLQTNGRRMAYRSYTAKLAEAGLTQVDVSLHGATAVVHEFHTTVAGSFQQTVAGIRRARDAGLATAVTSVLTRSNVHGAAALASIVAALGVRHWRVLLAQAVGRAAADARRIVPRWDTAARYLAEAQRIAAANGCRLIVGGLPPCIRLDVARWRDAEQAPQFVDACARCAYRVTCGGVDVAYTTLYGSRELRPVSEHEAATVPVAAADVSAFVGDLGRTGPS